MYFVNRSEIEETVNYIEKVLQEINAFDRVNNKRDAFALERMTHIVIESILDVGNMMIDGFIMRDPGSYHDIIDILIDERVIEEKDEKAYKDLIDLRQQLVQHFQAIQHDHLLQVLQDNITVYESFKTKIHTYLANELDVANAFSNEE